MTDDEETAAFEAWDKSEGWIPTSGTVAAVVDDDDVDETKAAPVVVAGACAANSDSLANALSGRVMSGAASFFCTLIVTADDVEILSAADSVALDAGVVGAAEAASDLMAW